MRLLLVNDDGYGAVGLEALRAALGSHECVVVAPDRERSACSHSLTLHEDLTFKTAAHGFAVSGTPADCVKLGVLHLLPWRPDFILSGINNGPNLGTDIIYSGTVSAALEGAYLGIRSIAISLAKHNADPSCFGAAAAWRANNLPDFASLPLSADTVLNINYPELAECKGYRYTKAGINLYNDAFVPAGERGGVRLQGEAIDHDRNPLDCDVERIKQGYVTVTPLHLDRNDYNALAVLQNIQNKQ